MKTKDSLNRSENIKKAPAEKSARLYRRDEKSKEQLCYGKNEVLQLQRLIGNHVVDRFLNKIYQPQNTCILSKGTVNNSHPCIQRIERSIQFNEHHYASTINGALKKTYNKNKPYDLNTVLKDIPKNNEIMDKTQAKGISFEFNDVNFWNVVDKKNDGTNYLIYSISGGNVIGKVEDGKAHHIDYTKNGVQNNKNEYVWDGNEWKKA